jgi:predicted HicB family RNase H-like nuclease
MTKPTKTDGFAMTEAFAAATQQPPAQDNQPPVKKTRGKAKLTYVAPSRLSRQQLGLWIPDNVHKALRLVAAQENMTLQQLGEEALHDLLVKKGATKLLKG